MGVLFWSSRARFLRIGVEPNNRTWEEVIDQLRDVEDVRNVEVEHARGVFRRPETPQVQLRGNSRWDVLRELPFDATPEASGDLCHLVERKGAWWTRGKKPSGPVVGWSYLEIIFADINLLDRRQFSETRPFVLRVLAKHVVF